MARVTTKDEWLVSLRQLTAVRAFWKLGDRSHVCGDAWIADYGPLPCDKPRGHTDDHRCYGSQGPITWRTLDGAA
jgi:hypothetical protein